MVWRLEHVQLAIGKDDEERCDAFYVDVLGFEVLEKPPLLAERGGRWYQRDEVVLHLGVEERFFPAKKAHPALLVDDYDQLLRCLEAAGIERRPALRQGGDEAGAVAVAAAGGVDRLDRVRRHGEPLGADRDVGPLATVLDDAGPGAQRAPAGLAPGGSTVAAPAHRRDRRRYQPDGSGWPSL